MKKVFNILTHKDQHTTAVHFFNSNDNNKFIKINPIFNIDDININDNDILFYCDPCEFFFFFIL